MAKAKRGGAFGLMRGSVGPVTYSIGLDGIGKKQQVIREKPVEVKNPRTRAQAIQRMKLKPIYNMERLLADIVDHSFKGVPVGVQSRQYFRKLAMTQQDVPFQIKGSLDVFPGGYQISEGSLGDTTAVLRKGTNAYSAQYNLLAPYVAGFTLPDTQAEAVVNDWASMSAEILALNPTLKNGDEIAVLNFFVQKIGNAYSTTMIKRRMILDTNFTTETPESFMPGADRTKIKWINIIYAAYTYNKEAFEKSSKLMESFHAGNSGREWFNLFFGNDNNADSGQTISVGNGTTFIGVTDSDVLLNVATADTVNNLLDGKLAALAFVASREVEGEWNFTTADICLAQGLLNLVNTQVRMEAAIASYMADDTAKQASSNYFLRLATGEEKIAVSVFPIRAMTQGQSITPTVIGGIDMESENGAKYLFTREVSGTTVVLDAPYGNVLTITVPPAEEGGQSSTVNVTPVMVYGLYEFVSENDIL